MFQAETAQSRAKPSWILVVTLCSAYGNNSVTPLDEAMNSKSLLALLVLFQVACTEKRTAEENIQGQAKPTLRQEGAKKDHLNADRFEFLLPTDVSVDGQPEPAAYMLGYGEILIYVWAMAPEAPIIDESIEKYVKDHLSDTVPWFKPFAIREVMKRTYASGPDAEVYCVPDSFRTFFNSKGSLVLEINGNLVRESEESVVVLNRFSPFYWIGPSTKDQGNVLGIWAQESDSTITRVLEEIADSVFIK